MYILEVTDNSKREAVLLAIINSIYDQDFASIDEAFIIQGFSYLDHSEDTKTDSIGIKDIKQFKKALWIANDETKLAIINNAHNLTVESQNALLKDLEEEPGNSIIILALQDSRLVLPTIRSRGMQLQMHQVQLIHPSIKEEKIRKIVYNGTDREEENFAQIKEFLGLNLYEKMKYITKELEAKSTKKVQEAAPKEDQVESFLLNLLSYYENSLIHGNSLQHVKLITDGLEKMQKGVKSSAVLEYIILRLNNG